MYYFNGSKVKAKISRLRDPSGRHYNRIAFSDPLFSVKAVDFACSGQINVILLLIKYLLRCFAQYGFSSNYCKVRLCDI